MLLHYCIWLNKEKYSSDTSWIFFFFSRGRNWGSFTSLQMDLKAYFEERNYFEERKKARECSSQQKWKSPAERMITRAFKAIAR